MQHAYEEELQLRVQRELELKEMRGLYEEEDDRMEEAQVVDLSDLDPSYIWSALPYVLEPCPEVPLPFLTGTHHDISKKRKDWLLSLIPLKVKGTIKFQGRLNQNNFANALSNKKALLMLMYNKDSGGSTASVFGPYVAASVC